MKLHQPKHISKSTLNTPIHLSWMCISEFYSLFFVCNSTVQFWSLHNNWLVFMFCKNYLYLCHFFVLFLWMIECMGDIYNWICNGRIFLIKNIFLVVCLSYLEYILIVNNKNDESLHVTTFCSNPTLDCIYAKWQTIHSVNPFFEPLNSDTDIFHLTFEFCFVMT